MSAQPQPEPGRSASGAPRPRLETLGTTQVAAEAGSARVVTALALGALAAGAIHVAAAITDADEGTMTVAFFALVAAAQIMWGAVALFRAPRVWLALGAIGNLAVLGVWIWSRTAGLPVGPTAGVALPVGAPDAITSAIEVAIVVGAGALAVRGRRVDRAAVTVPTFAVVAFVVAVGLAMVGVMAEIGLIASLAPAS